MNEQEIIESIFSENPGGFTIVELHDKLLSMGTNFDDYPEDSVMNLIHTETRRARGVLALDDDPIALLIDNSRRFLIR